MSASSLASFIGARLVASELHERAHALTAQLLGYTPSKRSLGDRCTVVPGIRGCARSQMLVCHAGWIASVLLLVVVIALDGSQGVHHSSSLVAHSQTCPTNPKPAQICLGCDATIYHGLWCRCCVLQQLSYSRSASWLLKRFAQTFSASARAPPLEIASSAETSACCCLTLGMWRKSCPHCRRCCASRACVALSLPA